MSEQLQSDFDKIVKNSKFSNREIQLKKDFSIYIEESGRINIAGITTKNIEYISNSINQVVK